MIDLHGRVDPLRLASICSGLFLVTTLTPVMIAVGYPWFHAYQSGGSRPRALGPHDLIIGLLPFAVYLLLFVAFGVGRRRRWTVWLAAAIGAVIPVPPFIYSLRPALPNGSADMVPVAAVLLFAVPYLVLVAGAVSRIRKERGEKADRVSGE